MAGQSKLNEVVKVDLAAAAAAKRGLWVVTAGFFLTFAGYAAIENLLSTFHARLGYYSSAMVYYCVGAPPACHLPPAAPPPPCAPSPSWGWGGRFAPMVAPEACT